MLFVCALLLQTNLSIEHSSIPFYWLLDVPQSAQQKNTKNTSPTKNQRKATLARCLNISTQASGNRMISLLNVRSLNLADHWTTMERVERPKGTFDMIQIDLNPNFTSTCQSLQFFEETIAGA